MPHADLTPSTGYEIKAYNRQSKQMEYVGWAATREDAIAAKRAFEEVNGTAKGSRSRLTVRAFVEARYLMPATPIESHRGPIKVRTISMNRQVVVPLWGAFGSERLDRRDEDVVAARCDVRPGHVVGRLDAMFAWALRRFNPAEIKDWVGRRKHRQ